MQTSNIPDIDIDTEYLTYDGLNRSATVAGVPMVPAILIVGVFLIAALFLLPALQIKSFLLVLLAIPILLFLKVVTANDSQAVRILWLELWWWLRRRNAGLFNNTFAVTATKYGRSRNDCVRFVKQNSDKAARRARLFAACQSSFE